jgi:hypothetical protein
MSTHPVLRILPPVLRLIAATGLLALPAARCPTAADGGGAPDECPDLDGACPGLSCVEFAVDDDGCPLCECAVQACVRVEDCADRGTDVRCDTGTATCERPPGCTDGDGQTPCAAACFGRCVYPDAGLPGLCSGPVDCDSGDCRQGVCVDDPTTTEFQECFGWCAAATCDGGATTALDPVTNACVPFPDRCVPPGWIVDDVRCR